MIKVTDAAFVRFSAPDLVKLKRFLEDFGLVVHEQTEDVLYARGTDGDPWIYMAERGEAGFGGIAFDAGSGEDLEAASKLEGASDIEPLDGPGGGHSVGFTDPDGFRVEVVHGRTPLEPLPVPAALALNRGSDRQRLGQLQRVPRGAAAVKRLGHGVVRVSDFHQSEQWYKSRFGFLTSDEVVVGDDKQVLTAFMRCDRGPLHVDHHSFLCVGFGEPGFEHAAFEVEDFDAVMAGHEWLFERGWEHAMGVGRHVLGAQVYDYWRDPWGHTLEHFTDGDLLDASVPPGQSGPEVALASQWGRMGPRQS